MRGKMLAGAFEDRDSFINLNIGAKHFVQHQVLLRLIWLTILNVTAASPYATLLVMIDPVRGIAI